MLIRDLNISPPETNTPKAREGIEGLFLTWQRAGQRAVDRLRARYDLPHLSVLRRLSGGFVPNVDLVESDEDVRLQIDLPGVREEDLEAAVEGASVTLRGIRRSGARNGVRDSDLYRSERYAGTFVRTVTLPCPVSVSRAEAHFSQGVLDLRFPKLGAPAQGASQSQPPRASVHAA